MQDPGYFGREQDCSACPSSATAEFGHTPSWWMALLVRRHFMSNLTAFVKFFRKAPVEPGNSLTSCASVCSL